MLQELRCLSCGVDLLPAARERGQGVATREHLDQFHPPGSGPVQMTCTATQSSVPLKWNLPRESSAVRRVIRARRLTAAEADKNNVAFTAVQRDFQPADPEQKFPPLNLARTAAALDAYDQAYAEFEALPIGADLDSALALIDAGVQAVREAFAADSADRNRREEAMRIGVAPANRYGHECDDCFVRKVVRRWRAGEVR